MTYDKMLCYVEVNKQCDGESKYTAKHNTSVNNNIINKCFLFKWDYNIRQFYAY